MMNRTISPPRQAIEYPVFSWPQVTELKPGLPLWKLSTGTQPVVKLELIFDAGTWYEPASGVAYFTAKMLLEGTQHRNAQSIAQYIDQHGANLFVHVQPDVWSITLVTLPKHLAPMLQLLVEVVLLPNFSAPRLAYLKQLKRESLKLAAEKHAQVARWHFKQLIFGTTHPYGRHLNEEAVEAVHLDQIKHYYQNQLLSNCRVLASGQLSDKTLSLIQEHLSTLPVRATSFTSPMPLAQGSLHLRVPKPDSLQTAMNLGKIFPQRDHPDYIALLVVNELLGGFFGSRLMRNLREDKGYTYGIGSRVISLRRASYLLITTEVIRAHAQSARQEIEKEIKILQTTPVPPEELTNLKNYMLGSFLSMVNTPFAIMDIFKSAHLHGLSHDYYEKQYETVSNIDEIQIMALAQQYLSGLSWVVVGE